MAHRAPLYSLCGNGPQCSGSTDFCFFCEFDNGGKLESSGQNLYENLKDIVRTMAENKKEIDSIIRAVSQNYDEFVKQQIAGDLLDDELVER